MTLTLRHDYRQLANSPSKFLPFTKNVKLCLSDSHLFPDDLWGNNLALRQRLFDSVDTLEVLCHVANGGEKAAIRGRDKLIQEMIPTLDQTVRVLELAFVNDPDKLYSTGFTVSQERRSSPRNKRILTASTDFTVENLPGPGRARAFASNQPGAWNSEIHVNQKDPSVEADWWHKSIFPDPKNMIMENLPLGNNFVRQRFHGPDGPGPWSSVVSIVIT